MFLSTPSPSEASSALYARDIADDGYVSNLARLWARRPDVFDAFMNVRTLLAEKATLSLRERAILVCATAAQCGGLLLRAGLGAQVGL
jgi:alkylhydroperoxidase family enzyme